MYKWISLFLLSFQVFISFSQNDKDTVYTQFKYDNGNISSEGYMENGKPNAYWKTYFENGTISSEGNRKNFFLDSLWIFYSLDGTIDYEVFYKNDLKNGPERKYNEGSVVGIYNNINNLKEGIAKEYYVSGQLRKILEFKNGLEDGRAYEYGMDGRVITTFIYVKGFIKGIENINRFNENNNKQDLWRYYYKNMQVKREEMYENGMLNGIVKEYNREGKLIIIENYLGGKLEIGNEKTVLLDIRRKYHEDGSISEQGTYLEGKKEGIFREYDNEGAIINSFVYKSDVKLGHGLVNKGGLYEGEWEEFYDSGELKGKGNYLNGLKEGLWLYYFRNKKIAQKGRYKEGKVSSNWTWYYENGIIKREESFRRGIEDGELIEYDKKGEIILKGLYIDGLKDGEWKYKHGDHEEYGIYRDDLKHGVWNQIYDNGKKKYIGEYVIGDPVGKHKEFYISGLLKETGNYAGAQKEGEWIFYNEAGNVETKMKYKRGEIKKINGLKFKTQ